MRMISKYYTKISFERLAQLLDFTVEVSEINHWIGWDETYSHSSFRIFTKRLNVKDHDNTYISLTVNYSYSLIAGNGEVCV